MLLFLLNYKASFYYYYFDLYQNRLIWVSLKIEAKIPRGKKKRFGSEVLNTVFMSARVSERSSLLHTDRVLLSVQILKVTELALHATRSSAFVVEGRHQYSSTSQKQVNLPGCFQMLQGNWRQMVQCLGIIFICICSLLVKSK